VAVFKKVLLLDVIIYNYFKEFIKNFSYFKKIKLVKILNAFLIKEDYFRNLWEIHPLQ